MSTTEDRARAAMRAIAATVHDAPPLRFKPAPEPGGAPDETEAAGNAPHRGGAGRPGRSRPGGHGRGLRRSGGTAGPAGRGRDRHWRSWLAPLTAAAVVVALAVALVLVRDIPNGSPVPGNTTTSTAGPGGVPRYYVALRQLAGDMNSNTQRNDIVVGDSLTGKTLATFAPPARTAFESVTAASDDRTFVVFGVTSSTGSFQLSAKDATLTGSWYAVRLAPGTAQPARLTRLPIKPQTVPGSFDGPPFQAFIDSFGTVLSGSGKELAVPEWIPSGLAVKVFSVATGRLLHTWTTHDRPVAQEPSLAWIDGDRELALVSRSVLPTAMNVTVREWPVAGPASGDLTADSKVVLDVRPVKHTTTGKPVKQPTTLESCVGPVVGEPVLISADGGTFSCTTAGGWGAVDHLSFHTYPLAASTTATAQGKIDYQVTFRKQGLYIPRVLWTSSSGGTIIGALMPYDGSAAAVAHGLRAGVISHGTFTPLRFPASLAKSTLAGITF